MPLSKLVGSRCPAICVRQLSRSRCACRCARRRRVPCRYDVVPRKQMFGRSSGRRSACSSACGRLLDGHRLAGQRRLVDEQVLGREQRAGRPGSCRRRTSRTTSPGTSSSIGISQSNGSAARRHAAALAVVCTMARSRAAALFERCSWTKAVRDRQHHHDGDDNGGPHVAQEKGDGRQRQQQHVERVPGTAPQFLRDRRPALARDQIEPGFPQAAFGLSSR